MRKALRNAIKEAVAGVVILSLGIIGCTKKEGDSSGEEKLDKGSYALGLRLGRDLKSQVPDLNKRQFKKGISDAFEGKIELKDAEIMQAIDGLRDHAQKKMQAKGEESKKEGEDYLVKNKEQSGIITTSSGLQYQVLTAGTGPMPQKNDQVKCHYKGTLINGETFDSSYDRNEPAVFNVSGVIPGWTEALQLMKTGSKWKLFIPSDLAYGPGGMPPKIPGNSVLVFEVELLEILKK